MTPDETGRDLEYLEAEVAQLKSALARVGSHSIPQSPRLGLVKMWAAGINIRKNVNGQFIRQRLFECDSCGKLHRHQADGCAHFAFCPTGEGGGIDPTCSPTGESAASGDSILRPAKLTAKENKALSDYQGGDYHDINGYLREGPIGYAPETVQRKVIALDKIIRGRGIRLGKKITLYRGVDKEDFPKTGDHEERGFMSATASKKSASFFGEVLTLNIPAGTTMLPILRGKEQEVLLPRGLTLEISGKEAKIKKRQSSQLHVNGYASALMGFDFADAKALQTAREKFTNYLIENGVEIGIAHKEAWGFNHSWEFATYAFCPTGEGGGIDNSCSPTGEAGNGEAVDSKLDGGGYDHASAVASDPHAIRQKSITAGKRKMPWEMSESEYNSLPIVYRGGRPREGYVFVTQDQALAKIHGGGRATAFRVLPGSKLFPDPEIEGEQDRDLKGLESLKIASAVIHTDDLVPNVQFRHWKKHADSRQFYFCSANESTGKPLRNAPPSTNNLGKFFMLHHMPHWRGLIDMRPGSPHLKIFGKYAELRNKVRPHDYEQSPAEKRVDFAAIEKALDGDAMKTDLALRVPIRKVLDDLIGLIRNQDKAGGITQGFVQSLTLTTGPEAQKILGDYLLGIWLKGRELATGELPAKLKDKIRKFAGLEPVQAIDFFRNLRPWLVKGIIDDDLKKTARLELTEHLKGGRTLTETIGNLRSAWEPWVGDPTKVIPSGISGTAEDILQAYRLENIVRTESITALSQGRAEIGDEAGDFVVGYELSPILDPRTSEVCNRIGDLNPFTFRKDNPRAEKLMPALHYQCRTIPVFVTTDDLPVRWSTEAELDSVLRLIPEGFK